MRTLEFLKWVNELENDLHNFKRPINVDEPSNNVEIFFIFLI